MGTTNTQITTPAVGSSCRGTGQGTHGWFGGRRGLVVVAAAVAAAATAVALGYHWLAIADLVPLLFVLPCAVMMLMCAKGNNGQQTNVPPASTKGEHRARSTPETE